MIHSTRNLTTRTTLSATAAHNARWFAGLIGVAALGLPAAYAQNWNGSVSSNWNEPNNWTPAGVPNAVNTRINTITPNYPVVTSNLLFNPNDIIIGMGAGTNGRYDQSEGQVTANAWLYCGVEGGNGVFNLTGNGKLSAAGRFYLGGSRNVVGGTGVATINTTQGFSAGDDIAIGAAGGTGTLNLNAGTVTSTGWTFVGKNEAFDGGNGTLNMSGGTWTHNGSRSFVGLGNTTGKMNLSGGTYNNTLGGNNDVFFAVGVNNNANANVAELNLTGGKINVNRLLSIGGVEANGGANSADYVGSGKGKMTINAAASVANVTGEVWVGQGAGSNGEMVLSAGTLQTNSWVAIGRRGGTGKLTMTGGSIVKTGGNSQFIIGSDGPGSMVQSDGIVDIQGGYTWIGEAPGSTSAILTLKDNAEFRTPIMSVGPESPNAVLNLDGGTLRTRKFVGTRNENDGASNGDGTIHFNGTQIVATADAGDFIASVDHLDVAGGGLRLDTNGFAVSAQPALAGAGGVIKSGAGSLTLGGANFTGASSVTGGTLNVSTDSTGGGAYTVANDAGFGVNQALSGGVLNVSALTLGNNSSLTVSPTPDAANPTTALLHVVGALSRTGPTAINLVDEAPAIGLLPVVSYGSKTGTGTFVVGKLPEGVTLDAATPIVDSASVISLKIARVNAPHWTGGGAWDFTSNNWVNAFGDTATKFVNGDPAIFEDYTSELPLDAYDVTLNTTVTPGSTGVTFDNDLGTFTLTGSGKISGSTGLTKRGFGELIIGNLANDFTGPVTIEEGTITVGQLANAASASPLGKGNLVLAGGTLNYTGSAVTIDRGFQINAAPGSTISELMLASNVTMSGPVTATAGKFRLSGAGVLTLTNPGPISLANGPQDADPATLVLDGGGLTLNGTGQTATVTGNTQIGVVGGTTTALTVSGNTVLNVNRFQVGFGLGSTPSVLIQNTAQIHKTATGWLSIANSNDSIATMTVRDSGSLVTDGGDFNVGDTATSTGNLIIQNSGLVTSAGPVFIGKNGTTGSVTMSESSTMSSGDTNVAGGNGSHGSLNLKGNSTYTSGGRMQVGPGGGSTGSVVIEDTAHLVANSYVSVGFNGGGNVTVKGGGSFATTDDLSVNEAGDVPASVTVQDTAAASAGGTVFIGRNGGKVGTLTVSGTATFDQTGSAAQNLFVGLAGDGTLNVQGNATVTAASANGIVLGQDASGVGKVNLDGGTLIAKRIFGNNGTSTFTFNGGLLRAAVGANADFMTGVDNAVVNPIGAKIDSNGQTIAVNQPLVAGTTAGGGLTKSGTGTLRLNGVNTYTGTTTVTAGALGGSGTLAGPLVVQSGAALAPGATTGTLNAQGVTLQAGSTFIVNIDDSQTAKNGRLNATGTLNVSGVALQVNTTGSASSAPYTIATAGTVTGTFASVPAGVSVSYGANSITITPPAGSSFDSWMSNFPTLTGPNAAKTADPDGDGMTNLEEFALDGNPANGNSTGKVRSRIETVGGEQALVITLPVRVGATFDAVPGPGLDATVAADGVIYNIKGSNNLTAFDQAVTEVTPASATGMPALSDPAKWNYRTFRLNGAVPARGMKGFLSVKVDPTP